MQTLTLVDSLALLIVAVALIAMVLSWYFVRLRKNAAIRLSELTEDLVKISQQAGEKGESIRLILGDHGLSTGYLASVSALSLQRALLRTSLLNDHPRQTISGDAALAFLSRQLTSGIYKQAVLPQLFIENESGYSHFYPSHGGLAAMTEATQSAYLLMGEPGLSSLLGLSQATQAEIPTFAYPASLLAQAAVFPIAKKMAFGEDYFAALDPRAPDRSVLAGLRAADILKILLCIALIAAIILRIMGELP